MADATTDYRKQLPDELRNFVGSFVEITLCEPKKLQGWVYTIDPVSYTVVIAKETEENSDNSKPVVIVMAKAIKQINIVKTTKTQPEWFNDFASKKKYEYTREELEKRKACVVEWLNKNRVPIVKNSPEDGGESSRSIQVIGGLVIEPPYDADSCQGTNEIVLERIRKLINTMPNN